MKLQYWSLKLAARTSKPEKQTITLSRRSGILVNIFITEDELATCFVSSSLSFCTKSEFSEKGILDSSFENDEMDGSAK